MRAVAFQRREVARTPSQRLLEANRLPLEQPREVGRAVLSPVVDDRIARLASLHLERLAQRCPGVGFSRDLVPARGHGQREANPVVLVLDMEVAVDHRDTVDDRGQADLLVVEGLVTDIQDKLCLCFVNEPDVGVGGGDIRVRSGIDALFLAAANKSPPGEGEGEGKSEAHTHKYGT